MKDSNRSRPVSNVLHDDEDTPLLVKTIAGGLGVSRGTRLLVSVSAPSLPC